MNKPIGRRRSDRTAPLATRAQADTQARVASYSEERAMLQAYVRDLAVALERAVAIGLYGADLEHAKQLARDAVVMLDAMGAQVTRE